MSTPAQHTLGIRVKPGGTNRARRSDKELGLFVIDAVQLADCVISVRHAKSHCSVRDFPRIRVSGSTQSFLLEVLRGNPTPSTASLIGAEREYCARLLRRSQADIDVDKLFVLNNEALSDVAQARSRLQESLGEFEAGNDEAADIGVQQITFLLQNSAISPEGAKRAAERFARAV